MKKTSLILAAMALTVSLAACADSPGSTNVGNGQPQTPHYNTAGGLPPWETMQNPSCCGGG
jgi:uncharacterized lipoprotein YehR (DUF1307 family)